MKVNLRTIIGILSGAVVVSCTTTTDEPGLSEIPIEFGTAVSRSVVTSPSDMSSFSVWGGYNGVNLFENTTVSRPAWTYEGGTRYWVPGKTFNFYAVHPSTLQNVEVSKDGTITVTSFDCSKTGTDAVDLMTATANRITSNNNPLQPNDIAPVSLNFSHELAKVKFIIESEGSDVEVSQFKLYNVVYLGNLNKSWETLKKNNESDDIYNSQPFSLNNNDGLAKDVFGNILIIPHADSDLENAKLTISYKYTGEADVKTQTLDLVTDRIKSWSSGQSYSYSLTIKPNGITFSGLKADTWEETSSGGNIPIK